MNLVGETLSMQRAALALRAMQGATGQGLVVLVSSTHPGEGKTTQAGLLARALAAQQEGEVLLVDAGLTPPATAARSAPGWAGLLAGTPLDGLAQAGSLPGLWTLPRGEGYHASQLFRGARIKAGLSAIRERFPLTLVDGPPLSACGALLAQADRLLLVVDASRTAGPAVAQMLGSALAAAQVGTDHVAGVMLNRQPRALPRWLGG